MILIGRFLSPFVRRVAASLHYQGFTFQHQALRAAGFWLHRFLPIHSRVFKPLMVNNDIYAGMSQVLWTDAVYVRRFTDFPTMDTAALQRIALMAHDLYGSFDLAALALLELDKRDGGTRQPHYLKALTSKS